MRRRSRSRTLTVCTGFDPELVLQVGKIDNDVVEAAGGGTTTANDGLDIGWVTSQKDAMSVTHHFSGVTGGQNYKVAGRDSTKGTDMPLEDGAWVAAPRDPQRRPALMTMPTRKRVPTTGSTTRRCSYLGTGCESATDDTRLAECLTDDYAVPYDSGRSRPAGQLLPDCWKARLSERLHDRSCRQGFRGNLGQRQLGRRSVRGSGVPIRDHGSRGSSGCLRGPVRRRSGPGNGGRLGDSHLGLSPAAMEPTRSCPNSGPM